MKNKQLYIYKLNSPDCAGYDEYDSAVVIAESVEAARLIPPNGLDPPPEGESYSS